QASGQAAAGVPGTLLRLGARPGVPLRRRPAGSLPRLFAPGWPVRPVHRGRSPARGETMTATHEEPFACAGVPGFRRWSAEHGCYVWRPSRRQPADQPFDLPGLGRRNRPTQAELDSLYDDTPAAASTQGLWCTGYVVLWNAISVHDGVRTRFHPGAFARSLRERSDIRLLIDHDDGQRLREGPTWVQLEEDRLGLKIRCRLPNSTLGHELAEQVRAGQVELSVGWKTRASEFLAEGIGSPCLLI